MIRALMPEVVERPPASVKLEELIGVPRVSTPTLDRILAAHPTHAPPRSAAVRQVVDRWQQEQQAAHQQRVHTHRQQVQAQFERRAKRSAAAKRGAATRRARRAQEAFARRMATKDWQQWAREVTDDMVQLVRSGRAIERVDDAEQAHELALAIAWALDHRRCACDLQYEYCWRGAMLTRRARRWPPKRG